VKVEVLLDGVVLFSSEEARSNPAVVRQLAQIYASMSDEDQAAFFEEVSKLPWMQEQAWHIGRHLRTCTCISERGRDCLREVLSSMEYDPERARQAVQLREGASG